MVAVRRSVERAAAQLATAGTREQAMAGLAGLGRAQLRAVARQLDVELSGADAKAAICRRLVEATVGARLDAAARDGAVVDAPAGAAGTEPVVSRVAVGEVHRYIKECGPVEVLTPEHGWRPCVRVEWGRYGTHHVIYVVDGGEWVLEHGSVPAGVRPAPGPPVDTYRVAPAAGQSRVVPGVTLRHYLGWQWLTPDGGWETVTGAHQRYRWFIATESGRDWCEPEYPVMVRPVAAPVERVRGEADVDCTCVWWADSPFVPGEATVYARYADAACPAHQPPAVPVATITPDGPAAAVAPDADRAGFCAALRALAAFLAAHPALPLPSLADVSPLLGGDDDGERAEVDRIAGILGVEPVANAAGTHYTAQRRFGDPSGRFGITYTAVAITAAAYEAASRSHGVVAP